MSFVCWKVDRYPYLSSTGTWDTTPITLTEFSRPIVETNSGDAKDSFSFTVNNFNGEYDNYFQPQDKIIIARALNSTTVSTSNIIIVGAVKDPPYNRTGSKNEIKVEGFNFSESIFSAMVFIDTNGQTIPQVIQTALNHVRLYAPNFPVTWNSGNPSVMTTGAAFPAMYKPYKNVSLRKVIEDLSSNAVTTDGNYFWYVDINNTLVWRPTITGSAVDTFNSSTDAYNSIKSGKDTKGIINYIIVKGGRDPAGNPIQKRYVDAVSAAKNGNKFYIYTDPGIQAETLTKQDMDKSDPAKKGQHTQRVPYSFPFTCSWQATTTGTSPTMTVGVAPSVANSSEYVKAIITEITARMDRAGNQLLRDYKNGKLSIDIGFEAGIKTHGLLDIISCTIPEVFTGTKPLRVREISYTSDTDIYSLQEDTGTI